ncbi:hypothetical protein DPM35_17080 [Mesorhizobium atlanticum]|uniref:Uncharacterized protein n=1 Tax=Mesorhizobium atlanticum TaxID=2233532 RepID=A0A330GVW3_9HYPH|nr:hypothetical protein DPM35_17080 [Mesorhizobium atlanticum]
MADFANFQRCRMSAEARGQHLSPRLRGEMPGRAMRGGATGRMPWLGWRIERSIPPQHIFAPPTGRRAAPRHRPSRGCGRSR